MKKRAYLVGIKGVAMTALAVYLKESGWEVAGSDVTEVFFTDQILTARRIPIKTGFRRENITAKYDLVVVTGAHGGMTNAEAVRAKELNIPVFMHGKYLGQIMDKFQGISVAGCHGKTTTSSMIACMLVNAKLDPSYAIGTAYINGLGAAGHCGRGKYLVAEADEYVTCPKTDTTPRFLWQNPKAAVITNIEFDHPDVYGNLDDVVDAYLQFVRNLRKSGGFLVACLDDAEVANLLARIKDIKAVSYGFSKEADYQIASFKIHKGLSRMNIKVEGKTVGEFTVSVPGKHNLLNAAASIAVCRQFCRLSWPEIRNGLKTYTGNNRRLEKIFEKDRLSLYDDYAHHPSEISATVNSVRDWFPKKRILVIFQPHTFSRTKRLLNQFAKALSLADWVMVAPIFPSARESFDPTITSGILAKRILKEKGQAIPIKNKDEAIKLLQKSVKADDLIITMGAGNLYLWHESISHLLEFI